MVNNPKKSSGNPLGKKADAEVAQTYTWIQSHLEEDPETSLPKQEVYEESFFEKNKIEPLCAADFGKVMKHVFPSEFPQDGSEEEREELSQASWLLVREWAEKVLSHKFPTVRHLARHLVDSTFVDARSVAAVTVLSAKALSTDKGMPVRVCVCAGRRACVTSALSHLLFVPNPSQKDKRLL
ncbi:hypothetical protein HPB49_011180 [Dermacentor silvarum]|uniref:Uncharacterized protein n=1 Tax=Dermacentor silvarum TaxID=543639 RepID=A0ACB8CKU8_DERSI|nr:hypothetical protein HPB49_011180 [Dermacentor silvarum]